MNMFKQQNMRKDAVQAEQGKQTGKANMTARGHDMQLPLHQARRAGWHSTVHSADGKGESERHQSTLVSNDFNRATLDLSSEGI